MPSLAALSSPHGFPLFYFSFLFSRAVCKSFINRINVDRSKVTAHSDLLKTLCEIRTSIKGKV